MAEVMKATPVERYWRAQAEAAFKSVDRYREALDEALVRAERAEARIRELAADNLRLTGAGAYADQTLATGRARIPQRQYRVTDNPRSSEAIHD